MPNHDNTREHEWLTIGKDVLDVIKSARDVWPIIVTAAVYVGGRFAHLWQAMSVGETALSLGLSLSVLSCVALVRRTRRLGALLRHTETKRIPRQHAVADFGLPPLPNPAIQHGLAIWAVRFRSDLTPSRPTLKIALLGINYGDDEVTLMKVAIPSFHIAASSTAPELDTELVRDEMVRLAPHQHFQFFVTRRLDADLLHEFATRSGETEYTASLTIEAQCRRGNNLFSYADGTCVAGVIGAASGRQLQAIADSLDR